MKKFYLLLITVMSFAAATAQTHFQPAFEGNGNDHMNIYIVESTIEGVNMEAGDEIAVFDGDVCAGVFVLTQAYIDGALGAINASKADSLTAGNGYIEGNTITFKLWDASELTEYDNVDITFVDPETGLEIAPLPFTVGASVFVRLNVDCTLTIQSDPIYTSASSGLEYMWVVSNSDWEVESLPSWLTVSSMTGTGDKVIRVNWTANTGASRTGNIIFSSTTCSGIKDTLMINQEGLLKSGQLINETVQLNDLEQKHISQIYPNPFKDRLEIEFTKLKGETIQIVLYDIQGKLIKKINREFSEGFNHLSWDANSGNGINVHPGIYLIQLKSNLRLETFKVICQGN